MKRIMKISGYGLIAVLLITAIGFLIYVSDYEKATEPAIEAMISSEDVIIEEKDRYTVYRPKDEVSVGIIFYPGGKVEPRVYARLCRALADQGIQTVVVKMPFNLAMFNIKGGDEVVLDYPEMKEWYMAGHSLGGVFATEYLEDNTENFEGMIYMASYPSSDMSESNLKFLSLNATMDTVINREAYETAKDLLPGDTIYYDIVGGNHTQFGDYDLQDGDSEAAITAEVQQGIIVEKVLEFINNK